MARDLARLPGSVDSLTIKKVKPDAEVESRYLSLPRVIVGGDLPGMPITLNGSDASSLANSEKACFKLCDERKNYGAPAERCIAWVVNVPGCKSPGHSSWKYSECWLKAGGGSIPKTIKNKCRVSGIVSKMNDGGSSNGANTVALAALREDTPSMCTLHSLLPKSPIMRTNTSSCGYWATKLMLNNQPAPFASGILSQGFWPDGEYTVMIPNTSLCC